MQKFICEDCVFQQTKIDSSLKQYLRELDQHEIHFKTFLYFCRPCGKGFYKHCKLNHHKKSCLSYLSAPQPPAVTSTYTPSSATLQQVSGDVGISQQQQQQQQPNVNTTDIEFLSSKEPEQQQIRFNFSAPKSV